MKRKDSVIKKTMELSILCGINIVTLCFRPQWRGQHVAPKPKRSESSDQDVQRVCQEKPG
ncbi:hypothetical protein CsSME_00052435 [Camellia sinensis var. sinensis]